MSASKAQQSEYKFEWLFRKPHAGAKFFDFGTSRESFTLDAVDYRSRVLTGAFRAPTRDYLVVSRCIFHHLIYFL